MQPTVEMLPVGRVKENPNNSRTHPQKQIKRLAKNIQLLGFSNPILVDENDVLLAGHGRLAAAKSIGLATVPVLRICGLSEARKRALLFSDNRLGEDARWDRERLAIELPELSELLTLENLDLEITGFEAAEIEQITSDFEGVSADPADEMPPFSKDAAVSRLGDRWTLANHRLHCGDARSASELAKLTAGERAHMAFLDPPYNVQIGSVVGRGRTKHPEFAMASGEMSAKAFCSFLEASLRNAAECSRDGAVHYVCIDWRHVKELIKAAGPIYGAMINLAVWVKSNAGQGSFYRSQHELIGVFRVGTASHKNNIELGRHGRNRSNVWHYAGVNTFRTGRMGDLSAHPTVKPVALVADAMKDCTRRGDVVLDTFCGSGTTILAAERIGRQARAMEIDPCYVDVAIRRWQAFTGKDAVHGSSGQTFDELAENVSSTPTNARRARGRRS